MKNRFHKKGTSQGARIFSCALFVVFAFIYVYDFQVDAIGQAQHMLSDGQTKFHPLIGSCVIVAVVTALQHLSQRLLPFNERFYSLSFIPSAMLLVLLTAFTPTISMGTLGAAATAIAVWIISFFIVKKRSRKSSKTELPLSSFITNVCSLTAIFLFVGLTGQTNDIWHYELKTARYLNDANYGAALSVGKHSLSCSPLLTALRAYAMSHEDGGLGENLFDQPLPEGGARLLLLKEADTVRMAFPIDSLYSYMGVTPRKKEDAMQYFERAAKTYRTYASHTPARDYWLCSLLLEKQLDRFAEELPLFYEVSNTATLPRYYAEALLLYSRLRTTPTVVYHNSNLEANLRDFFEISKKLPDRQIRCNELRRIYGNTYFWYYLYHPYLNVGRN